MSWIISSFSEAVYLIYGPSHPRLRFFQGIGRKAALRKRPERCCRGSRKRFPRQRPGFRLLTTRRSRRHMKAGHILDSLYVLRLISSRGIARPGPEPSLLHWNQVAGGAGVARPAIVICFHHYPQLFCQSLKRPPNSHGVPCPCRGLICNTSRSRCAT